MGYGEYDIEQELQPDEKLLWKGKPATGLRLQPSDAGTIPFTLMWAGFAFFWEYMAVTDTKHNSANAAANIIFPLWGIPFILVGIYMVIGRFFVDAWMRSKIEYALTDKRVIIVSRLFSRRINSIYPKTLADVAFSEKADGSGTITFNQSQKSYGNRYRNNRAYYGLNADSSFQMIDHVRDVYALITKVQHGGA